jgi:hypothetical protein
MINALVNDIECKFYYDERFLPEQAPIGYPFMYQLRHDEDDWTCPISLEKFVLVNFFGSVFMEKPIVFGKENYIEVNQFKIWKNDYIKFEIRKETFNKILQIGNSKPDD